MQITVSLFFQGSIDECKAVQYECAYRCSHQGRWHDALLQGYSKKKQNTYLCEIDELWPTLNQNRKLQNH